MTAASGGSVAVVVERLDGISKQLAALSDSVSCLEREQKSFMIEQTRKDAEIYGLIKTIDDKAERAHQRIDAISKIFWAVCLPIILGLLGLLWGLVTHQIQMGGAL